MALLVEIDFPLTLKGYKEARLDALSALDTGRLPTRQGRITGCFQIEGHQDKKSNAEACGFSIVTATCRFVQQSHVFMELLFLCLLY